MSSAGLSHWTQAVAFGIVAVATVIGNISLMASETASHPAFSPLPARSTSSRVTDDAPAPLLPNDRLSGVGYSGFYSSASGVDADTLAHLPSAPLEGPTAVDAVQIVPAIYAWDPDVRFVFYRHVSKWM